MVLNRLKQLPKEELRVRLNLWLMVGHCPTRCCIGETVMIPKDLDNVRPPKHRPITIADMIIRCFHKLLGKRMADLLLLSERQAFCSGNGLAENVYLLHAVIDHHTRNLLPLNVVFLDILKAFDSVSHYSFFKATQCMGVPPPFLTYLQESYGGSQTSIRVGNDWSESIYVRRGMKQGDPMSVHLFNVVIDWALAALDPSLSVEIGEGAWINHLAFADDIALVTRTSVGAQRQVDLINMSLSKCGLAISVGRGGKSASLRIDVDQKKKWVVNPSEHLYIGAVPIPACSITQTYKY